jgi:Cof subfamily protein (haloacid dehalogenase superfamily)
MFQVKLIATDLDGTLLDSTGKISERNLKSIRETIASGVAATICTGRMFSSARQFAEQLGIKLPVICYNGAILRHLNGESIWHYALDMEMAREILSMCVSREVHVQSYVEDELQVRNADASVFQNYMKYFGVTGRVVGDDLSRPSTNPTKLLAMTDTEEEARAMAIELSERYGDELYVTRSLPTYVEVMNPKANKVNALTKLAETIGVDMGEILAIGDGENDVEMVKSVGVGIAMGNGADRIKGVAKYIAPTNDEDGVSWAMDRFVLGSNRS